MISRSTWLAGISATILAGCQTTAATPDFAALIVNPTPASREELQSTVNEVLHSDVTIADDALTKSSILTIEQRPRGSVDANNALGRNMSTPVQFHLVISGTECVLVDLRDDARYRLRHTECERE